MNVGAERLYQWRVRRKLKQRHVAQAIDVDQSLISNWENGGRTPGLDVAVALERYTDGFVKCEHWTKAA